MLAYNTIVKKRGNYMNFSDFINNQNVDCNDENRKKAEQTAKTLVDKYKNMDQNSLMNEFISQVSRQKQQGTFDKQKIIQMLDSVKAMIPADMYNQALHILNQL